MLKNSKDGTKTNFALTKFFKFNFLRNIFHSIKFTYFTSAENGPFLRNFTFIKKREVTSQDIISHVTITIMSLIYIFNNYCRCCIYNFVSIINLIYQLLLSYLRVALYDEGGGRGRKTGGRGRFHLTFALSKETS
jgi:hypothetical protein